MERNFVDGYLEWQSDPEITGVNKLPQHANLMPYSDFEEDLDYDASEDKDTEENDSDEEDNDTASVTDEEPAAVIDEDQDNKADAKDSFTGEDEAKTDSDVKSDEASDRNSDDEAQSADGSFKLNYVDDKDTSSNVTITEDAE